MKIAHKISILILTLFVVLGINTFIGLHQLAKIEQELQDVARQDVALIEHVTSIRSIQLEKGILFERMLRIAEELAFEDVIKGRREHLLFQADLIRKGFVSYTQKGAEDLVAARVLIVENLKRSVDPGTQSDFLKVQKHLKEIEQSYIHHADVVTSIFEQIQKGEYELSFEDIERVTKDERRLSREIQLLLAEVQGFIKNSLKRAQMAEREAKSILFISLIGSVFVFSLFVLFLIRSISRPLKKLTSAAHKIGEGDFAVHLDKFSKDEIGEVSAAFNIMSQKLAQAQEMLEQKNIELEENLKVTRQQKDDLEKVNKELDRFAYTVSHDIGAPLRGIAWYADNLYKTCFDNLDEKQQKSLNGIIESVDRLNEMITDLLALTRIARVRNPFELTDMNKLLLTISKRFDVDIAQQNVDYNLEKNFPEMICDRIKIGELFYNLINNAIKFSSKNNKNKPKVQVGYIDAGSEHQIYVKDNGIGIDPAYHEQVFGVFRRLNSSRDYKGSGIGLSIVKEVVDLHGGRIWIESELGSGTTFYFTIPKNLTYSV